MQIVLFSVLVRLGKTVPRMTSSMAQGLLCCSRDVRGLKVSDARGGLAGVSAVQDLWQSAASAARRHRDQVNAIAVVLGCPCFHVKQGGALQAQ